MKLFSRLAFSIFFIQVFIFAVHSQPVMGFQAGINVSGLLGHKTYDENKPRFGLSGYLFTDIPLGHNSIVSIETGLSFSPQGSNHVETTRDVASVNVKTTHNKLNYVILPIYLKENYSNFYTKIGPYAAYLINGESTWKNTETKLNVLVGETSGTNELFKKNASVYDLGLSFGFGFIHFFDPNVYRNKRHRNRTTPVMQVDFKYNLGFTRIDASGAVPNMNLKNQCFTLGLSFTSVHN